MTTAAVAAAVTLGWTTRLPADRPPPTSAPVVHPPDLARGGGGRGHGGPRRGGLVVARGGPPTAAERDQALGFLHEHAPESYKVITALPAEGREVQEMIVARAYLNYQQVKANGQDGLYEAIVKRVEAEDTVYGLTLRYRQAAAGRAREALLPQLRAAVTALTTTSLQERELRLVRLERTASRERDRLAADTAHKDELINARLNAIALQADAAPATGDGEKENEGGNDE